ncbi:hypothetical protein [Mucilaginibacter psychrotolerans]|uniref:Uncharacterized protein n=1 Tax=Mucilaginibacter psychrotolerans TaxID=1524096 RepID=A0A4Y8SFV7_9SPHI|nr:hypothetical protein [Mucilaginibacter psychrotolerans]TFF37276.1 hypothetical protein E2R66_12630 [Mucilaginibacter psychrotolerans]
MRSSKLDAFSIEDRIAKTINVFFENVAISNYKKAEKLLHLSLSRKGRSEDGFIFENFYPTLAINDIKIFDLLVQTNSAECYVFFKETVRYNDSQLLAEIRKADFNQLEQFIENLRIFYNENIKDSKYFEKSMRIGYLFDIEYSQEISRSSKFLRFSGDFPERKTMTLNRLFKFKLVHQSNRWLITLFENVDVHFWQKLGRVY